MTVLTRLQRRGMMTIPQELRESLQLEDGQVIVLTEQKPGQWLCQAILPAQRFFALFDDRVPPMVTGTVPAEPHRWLDVALIVQAQHDPESAARARFEQISRGMETIQADPVLIPDLLYTVAQWSSNFSRHTIAFYVQTLLAWPGIIWPERTRYLTALTLWAQDDALTWSQAVMQSHREEPLIMPQPLKEEKTNNV